jgi:hypothetical protein
VTVSTQWGKTEHIQHLATFLLQAVAAVAAVAVQELTVLPAVAAV